MGVYGLSMLGLMEADPLLIQAEKRLISQAEELIVLVDSSKFAAQGGADPVRPEPRVHRHHRHRRVRCGRAAAGAVRRARWSPWSRRRSAAAVAGEQRASANTTYQSVRHQIGADVPIGGINRSACMKIVLVGRCAGLSGHRRQQREKQREKIAHRDGRQKPGQRLLRRRPHRRQGRGQGAGRCGDHLHRPDHAERRKGQIEIINSLISQKVDAIVISANDAERAGADHQEGHAARHQGDFVRQRPGQGRPLDAAESVQRRADRPEADRDGGRRHRRQGRDRDPVGIGAGDQPEHLDRRDEEDAGEARVRQA